VALTLNPKLSEDQRDRLQDLGALSGGEFDDVGAGQRFAAGKPHV